MTDAEIEAQAAAEAIADARMFLSGARICDDECDAYGSCVRPLGHDGLHHDGGGGRAWHDAPSGDVQ